MDTSQITPEAFSNAMSAEGTDSAPQEGLPNQEEKTSENPVVEVKDVTPTPKEGISEETDWKKRYDDTRKYSQQLVDVNVKLVGKNPDLLADIAEADPELADKVSEKINGIKYADFQERQKLEKIKEEDPQKYDAEVRLRNLEQKEKERQLSVEAAFFESKKIQQNSHDTKYQKVMEQMEMLNPSFVEANRERALEMAYNLAYPASAPNKEVEALVSNTSGKGGNVSPSNQLGVQKKMGPKATAFSQAMRNV